MRHLSILALALVGAAGLLALTGTASADVLCKTAPNKAGECATSPGDYPSGTAFTAEASSPVLTTTNSAVSERIVCEKSVLSWKSTSTGNNTPGSGIPLEVTDLTFTGGCITDTGIKCTVSTATGNSGEVKATDNSGNGVFTIQTPLSIATVCNTNCLYTASGPLSLSLTAGNPAVVGAVSEPLPFQSGLGCATTLDWTATYKFTGTNVAVWVATKMA